MNRTRRFVFLSLDDCPPQPGLQEYQLDAFGNGQTSQRLTVDVSAAQPR